MKRLHYFDLFLKHYAHKFKMNIETEWSNTQFNYKGGYYYIFLLDTYLLQNIGLSLSY